MAAADDQQPVETFGADGADEALGIGVRPWCADRRVDHLEAFAAEDLVEGDRELTVTIVDQKPCPREQAAEAEVARLLGHPGTRRVGRATGQVDASALELDEKENVQAAQRKRLHCE